MVGTGEGAPRELDEITIHSTELVDRPAAGLPFTAPVEIIVEAAAWAQMTRHASEDLVHEVGGIMVGEVFEHEGRGAVRVTGAVPAHGAIKTLASLQFTNEVWGQMEKLRRDSARGEKLVGWYHTHPGLSVFFSSTDTFMHESFFTQPWHVALVLDPISGEHRFYRWDGGAVRASRDFLLQCSNWLGPQPPLHLTLGSALRRTADAVAGSVPDSGATLVGSALRRLADVLKRSPTPAPGDDLLSLLVTFAALPPEVVAAARRRCEGALAPDRVLAPADLTSVARARNPAGPLAVGAGWLAQLVNARRVHVTRFETAQPFNFALDLPLAVQDLAGSELGQLMLLTRDPHRLLCLLDITSHFQSPARIGAAGLIRAIAWVEIDWGPFAPPQKVVRVQWGRRFLYLLGRGEIHVLEVQPGPPWKLRALGAQPASACGWDSFEDIKDWSVDAGGVLVVARKGSPVWCFEPLQGKWKPLPTTDLECPERLCAGLTTLWVYDSARAAIARYTLPDARPLGCLRVSPELGQQIWRLATDGLSLFVATRDEVLRNR